MVPEHKETKVEDGRKYIWDVDTWLWPDGIWIPVCMVCERGPLTKGGTYCGDFNGIRPGECLVEIHGTRSPETFYETRQ